MSKKYAISCFMILVAFSLIASSLLVAHSRAIAQSSELQRLVAPASSLLPAQATADPDQLLVTEPSSITAETVLYATHDAPVLAGAPTATHPAEAYLGAGYDNGSLYGSTGVVRSYLRFDLSSIPAGSTIVSATLHLTQAAGQDYPATSRTVTFYRVTGSWDENTLNWNNKPNYAEAVGSVTSTYNYSGGFDINVTSLVSAWYNGTQPNYGIVAVGPETILGVYRAFFARGYVGQPELRIRYLPAPPPVLDAWPGTLNARASSTQLGPIPSLQVSNVTLGTLDWSAAEVVDAPWLTLNKTSGTASPTAPDAIGFSVNQSGLPLGTHTAQIRVSSSTPGVVGSPITVTFSLNMVNQLNNVYLPVTMKGGSGSTAPQIVALVFGVADYQYLDPPPGSGYLSDVWGYDLFAPDDDVIDFENWLRSIGVSPSSIIKRAESAATHASVIGDFGGMGYDPDVVTAFEELDQKESKNTIVIIYYSGHGGRTPDLNGDESDGYDEFIALYDTQLITSATTYTFTQIITDDALDVALSKLESEHIVVILDSCFSGSMVRAAAAQTFQSGTLLKRGLLNLTSSGTRPDQAALSELVAPGRVIITGGTGDQLTYESPSPPIENGIFTWFFLQGLQDAIYDVNQNDSISAEEAFWFTRDAVDDWISTNVISTTIVHQNPDIDDRHFGQIDLTWLP